jgi:plasmid stabilization system protein ParE
MRIRWTPPAVADLESVGNYLKKHHPQYRHETMRKLYEKIRDLKNAPDVGRPGRVEGTREIFFPPLRPAVEINNGRGRRKLIERAGARVITTVRTVGAKNAGLRILAAVRAKLVSDGILVKPI